MEAHQVRSQALPPRETIIGLQLNGDSKAYPLSLIDQHRLIVDQLGKIPLLMTLATDGLTVRAFDRRVEGRALDFYVKAEDSNLFIDNTGTEWNFDGVAISGELAGKKLQKLVILKDFWFDWLNYHPNTSIYGERRL